MTDSTPLPYRRLLSTPGSRAFVLAGWFGRFPRACLSLGIVLLVESTTGRFTSAALVAAAFVVGMAISGPLWSVLMDRYGQTRVLAASVIALTASTLALVQLVEGGAPVQSWVAVAVGSGLSSADIGSATRARWSDLVGARGRHTAFALESIADESVFVVAPPIATVLAASVDPAAGALVALGCGIAGGIALMLLPATQPRVHARKPRGSWRALLPPLGVLPVVLASFGIGALFGCYDITSVGWAAERGVPGLAGVSIAAFGFATAVGAFATGALLGRVAPMRRYLAAAATTALLSPLLPLTAGSLLLIPATIAVGLALSPLLVTGPAVAEARAPAGRRTEAMAYPGAAMSIGVTLGSTSAGAILDAAGATTSFLVAVAASVGAVLLAGAAEALVPAAKRD